MRNIMVICQGDGSRRWESEVILRLQAIGCTVAVRHSRVAGGVAGAQKWLDRILKLEARRFGPCLASPAPVPAEAGDLNSALTIDLTGRAAGFSGSGLTLGFSGHSNVADGIAAILAGKQAEILAFIDGKPVGKALPMLRDRLWLSRLSDDLLSGAISLIVQTVARRLAVDETFIDPRNSIVTGPKLDGHAPNFLSAYLSSSAHSVAARIARRRVLGRRPFYWQVAYRLIDGPGVAETGRLDGAPFTVLEDDGERFYADPFPIIVDGRYFLFVEEFGYQFGRGRIAVAELGADGRFGPPKVVIEAPHHLSYPQIVTRAGEIFMIPESSAARELVLYRAERFPDLWVRDTVLLANRDINDATLLEHDGRFWLFGTERFGHGSPSDTMTAYSAPDLRGPWTPHPLNPLLIDCMAARPGGNFLRQGQKIVLPVQDGSQSYGGGLGLVDLLRLDDGGVEFGSRRPILAGPAWPRAGIHTLNRAGRLEVVDSAG